MNEIKHYLLLELLMFSIAWGKGKVSVLCAHRDGEGTAGRSSQGCVVSLTPHPLYS